MGTCRISTISPDTPNLRYTTKTHPAHHAALVTRHRQVAALCNDAFGTPIPASDAMRASFTIGGELNLILLGPLTMPAVVQAERTAGKSMSLQLRRVLQCIVWQVFGGVAKVLQRGAPRHWIRRGPWCFLLPAVPGELTEAACC